MLGWNVRILSRNFPNIFELPTQSLYR